MSAARQLSCATSVLIVACVWLLSCSACAGQNESGTDEGSWDNPLRDHNLEQGAHERSSGHHHHSSAGHSLADVFTSDDLVTDAVRKSAGDVQHLPTIRAPKFHPLPTIPRILHQSWKSDQLPVHFYHWRESWKRNHPDWEYRLWTDQANRELVTNHYSWFLPTYDSFPNEIFRADACRVLYMHRFGGVYADLDVESLKPLDPLLDGQTLVFARLSNNVSNTAQGIPNAFMASAPGHEFWMYVIADIQRQGTDFKGGPDHHTGPGTLHRSLPQYEQDIARHPERAHHKLTILPASLIYPSSWERDRDQFRAECIADNAAFNATSCKAHFPEAFTITYWAHTWWG